MEDINVGETVTPHDHQEALPVLRIDEPTLEMTFKVNNSPFAGREGDFVTASNSRTFKSTIRNRCIFESF